MHQQNHKSQEYLFCLFCFAAFTHLQLKVEGERHGAIWDCRPLCFVWRGSACKEERAGASLFQLAGQPRRECGKRKVSVGLSPQWGVARGAQVAEQQLVCEGWVGEWACLGVGSGGRIVNLSSYWTLDNPRPRERWGPEVGGGRGGWYGSGSGGSARRGSGSDFKSASPALMSSCPDQYDWLRAWPSTPTPHLNWRNLAFLHATPRTDEPAGVWDAVLCALR